MENLARVERKTFTHWLRTGRWLRPVPSDPQRKFNPNHDPTNGRFTSGGGSFGGGGSGDGGGAGGSWGDPARLPALSTTRKPAATDIGATPGAPREPAAKPGSRHVVSNGYDYSIDGQGRTRSVSGDLTLNPDQGRSRRTQREAGGSDRLPTDDGGHYIAPRFNGPTDAFNHFAQDSSVNRGRYRALEDQWARAKRAGHAVTVRIAPSFRGPSKRPSALNIWFDIDGDNESIKLPN